MLEFRRVLVPVDGSATSAKALAAAQEIARQNDGLLLLVHAVDPLAFMTGFEGSGQVYALVKQGAERVLADSAKSVAPSGIPTETRLVDQPGERLGESVARIATDWKADLVVVGTHGRRGAGRVLLGSGAEEIIRQAPVPVLVIRAAEAD